MNIKTIGIDLAKSVFQVHGVDAQGKVALRKRLSRSKLVEFMKQLPAGVLVGMEACGSAHYWARRFRDEAGCDVRLIPPQYVKPFVKTNKSDLNDAEAICEAVQRPNMHFVPIKTSAQQDVLVLHTVRERLVGGRTQLVNEMRALLYERGVTIAQGISKFRAEISAFITDEKHNFSSFFRQSLSDLYTEFNDYETRIKAVEKRIEALFKGDEVCQRVGKIEGIGPMTATAIVASVTDPNVFKNGRQMAAWLGLVPKQNSSGNTIKLSGISKRGNGYIRRLLIHGGRSAVLAAHGKGDSRSKWIQEKHESRGSNRAAVAVANKNARIIWKMLKTGETYRTPV